MGNNKTRKGSEMQGYVGTNEAAKWLGCSRIWVERLCRQGKLPAARPLRRWWIKVEDLEAMVKRRGE